MAQKRERVQGRKESGRFARLPHSILMHPSVTSLPAAMFRVLVAVVAQYDGRNNGALALPLSSARGFGITSANTLSRGLREIQARGLVLQTDPGSYTPPLPARYAVTWLPTDNTPWTKKGPPTSAFREWNRVA